MTDDATRERVRAILRCWSSEEREAAREILAGDRAGKTSDEAELAEWRTWAARLLGQPTVVFGCRQRDAIAIMASHMASDVDASGKDIPVGAVMELVAPMYGEQAGAPCIVVDPPDDAVPEELVSWRMLVDGKPAGPTYVGARDFFRPTIGIDIDASGNTVTKWWHSGGDGELWTNLTRKANALRERYGARPPWWRPFRRRRWDKWLADVEAHAARGAV